MSEVVGSAINVAAADESSPGVLSSGTWLNLEADAIGDPGPEYVKQARNPFSITRQLRRPFVAGLNCALTLDLDVIKDHVDFLGPHIFKSNWKHSGGTGQSKFIVTAVTDGGGSADGFTVAAAGALAANTLIVTRGLTNAANNGLFVVTTGSGATSVKVPTATLVAEASPPANATLDVAGYQFPLSDLELDADGNFICTADDFTTKGLQVGQFVYIASSEEQDPPYVFDTATYHGFAEIVTIAAKKLTVRRRGWTVASADDGDGKTIRMFFTKWIRNVARGHADEAEPTVSFEITYPKLAAGAAGYEYLKGYALNTVSFQLDSESKVMMQAAFIGRTADDPTSTRAGITPLNCVTGLAVSTSADITRWGVDNVDETGLMTDFQSLAISLGNGITPHKAIGHLGNRFTPLGDFTASMSAEVYFTDMAMVAAVSDNRVVRAITGGRNSDFGFLLDIPSAGSMTADKSIAKGELVRISSEISGFMDATSGYTAGMSVFAFLPTQAPGLET